MNRRSFIKLVAATAVAAMIPISEATCCPTVLTNKAKELLIAEALSTPEGRRALAECMVEPITCQMPKYAYTDEELKKGNFVFREDEEI